MEHREVVSTIQAERANPPKTTAEAAHRLAQILRNLDLYLPNHRWDYFKVLEGNDGGWRKRQYHMDDCVRTAEQLHECGTYGCALGIACLLWGWDYANEILPSRDGHHPFTGVFIDGTGGYDSQSIADELDRIAASLE